MAGTSIAGSAITQSTYQSNLTADELYDSAVNGYDKIRDPILKIACAFLRLDLAMSGTIQQKADDVQAIAKKMAGAHDMMAALNTQLQALGKDKGSTADDSTSWRVFGSTDRAAVEDFYNKLLAAGVPADDISTPLPTNPPTYSPSTTDGQWEVVMTKGQMSTGVQDIQTAVDDLSSASQQGQLDLQTLMNRFNSLVDAITSAIKKFEGEAVSADNGLRGP